MRELIAAAGKKNIYVLLDEAFIDYTPEDSLTATTDELSNLIVFRSVTKFHGTPGLRVAYAVANRGLAASINNSLPPWPITTLAARAVIAALDDEPYAVHTRSRNEARRETLKRALEALSLIIYPSAANFLLFRLPPTLAANTFWQYMIVNHGLVLRTCTNYEALPDRHFRIAVRTEAENRNLVAALKQALINKQCFTNQ
jgi:threonine-phosphate decarboxylase